MSTALRKPNRVSRDDYLAFEETSTVQHELTEGVIFAISGGSDAHNIICTNLTVETGAPLRDECQAFQGQMIEHRDDGEPSTESLDRDGKFVNYTQLPSRQEYVLVAQDVPQIEVMRRRSAWRAEFAFMGDTTALVSRYPSRRSIRY